MGGKKKKGGGKKKKAKSDGDEEDMSVQNFYKAYRKKCAELECDIQPAIKKMWFKFEEDAEIPKKFHIWDELGWPGVKAIVEAWKASAYPHLFSIRLWKTYCEDEGVRQLCTFLNGNNTVAALDLLDNKITSLGCEFLGETLSPGRFCPGITVLKLDHNAFGSEGLNALIKGIHSNEFLRQLSFQYCNLDEDCARSLFEMLIYSKGKVEEIELAGNNLRNEGTKMVLRGVAANKSLKKLGLADNQFNEDEDVLDQIKNTMAHNKTLKNYDFQYNDLRDKAVFYFVDMLGPEEEGKISHVTAINISERVHAKVVLDEETPDKTTPLIKVFKDALAANKPKKKKKGGKGKKKKKK